MSKTERDLAGEATADALDELFDDEEFDEALGAALDAADDRLPGDPADADVDPSGSDAPADAEQVADLDADQPDDDDGDDTADLTIGAPRSDDTDDSVDESDAAVLADDDDAADASDAAPLADDEVDADGSDAAVLVDDAVDTDEAAVDVSLDVDTTDVELADVDAQVDTDDGLPVIVQATPDGTDSPSDGDAPAHAPVAFVEEEVEEELDADEVAEEILEELRRADIDGPQVEMAPQDETTAARRRPRRSVDYDPAPMPIPAQVPRVLGRKPRVRKVTRVVRHVDPWSVFKIAVVANLVLYITVLTAGVLLWNVAHATGTVDNVERFFESFGWEQFEFKGGEIYHAAWIAGLFAVIGLTGLAVLLATLFNLITDLVGGVRFTVLEEEVVETRTSPLRRFVVRRPEPEVPAKISDGSGAMYREAVVDDTGANERPSR